MRFLRSVKTLFVYKQRMYKERNYFITTRPFQEDWSDDDERNPPIDYMAQFKGLFGEFKEIYAVS